MACDTVGRFVEFQATGRHFGTVWNDIGGIVRDFARRHLRSLGVRSPWGEDAWAVDDVVQQVALRLVQLGEPEATGRFDPSRTQPGLSGLRGWLWRVVERQSVDWTRLYRGGREVAMIPLSNLVLNELRDDDGPGSFEGFFIAKIERPDLLPILEDCIAQLPDAFMRRIVLLKLEEAATLRTTARQLAVPATRVGRTLREAYALLRPLVIARGIDEDWFDSVAA
jgi:RNA polymerase sigma factor (sigma-70 family)